MSIVGTGDFRGEVWQVCDFRDLKSDALVSQNPLEDGIRLHTTVILLEYRWKVGLRATS